MFTRHFVAPSLILATLAACPEGPTFVTTDDASTGDQTTAAAPTTGASSTGDGSTTSPTTGDASSTGDEPAPGNCGAPAKECAITNREWCTDLGTLCDTTPLNPLPGSSGTDYCEIVEFQCADRVPPCQMCNYIANTCKQLGGGAKPCNEALAECLCLATAHGIEIEIEN